MHFTSRILSVHNARLTKYSIERIGCVQTGDWISCYIEGHVSPSACSNCIMQSALYLHLLDQPSHAWHMAIPKKIDVSPMQRDFKLNKKILVINTK